MSETIKNFTFDTTAESWMFTPETDSTGTYNGTEQALDSNLLGRNKVETSYWEWTGTWEDLGVTSGNTVSEVVLDFDWKCYIANVSDGYTTGPAELRDSAGTTLIGTFSSGASGSGTTTYATQTGSAVTVTSSYQASTTTIKLRVSITLDNGNNASAETRVYYDNIDITVTHSGGTTRRIFNIG